MTKDILLVEDEPATRSLLSEIFTLRGHSVRTATDGFAALQAMRTAVPDVLVSDLNMPGMSGFELLSVVRRRFPQVFVIATSGAYTGISVPEGVAADAFYPKATRVQRLVELIEVVERANAAGRRIPVPVPIWIAPSDDALSGKNYLMLSCPECLRAIPQTPGKTSRKVHVTDCMYCKAAVHYAIVQRLDPATSQPYARLA